MTVEKRKYIVLRKVDIPMERVFTLRCPNKDMLSLCTGESYVARFEGEDEAFDLSVTSEAEALGFVAGYFEARRMKVLTIESRDVTMGGPTGVLVESVRLYRVAPAASDKDAALRAYYELSDTDRAAFVAETNPFRELRKLRESGLAKLTLDERKALGFESGDAGQLDALEDFTLSGV